MRPAKAVAGAAKSNMMVHTAGLRSVKISYILSKKSRRKVFTECNKTFNLRSRLYLVIYPFVAEYRETLTKVL